MNLNLTQLARRATKSLFSGFLIFQCSFFLLTAILRLSSAGFTTIPSRQVVGVGQKAVFRCLHSDTTALVTWRVNGNITSGQNAPLGIDIGDIRDGNRVIQYTLTITANSTFNETEIVCVAVFVGSMRDDDETMPVRLLIQGSLSMVFDIDRTSTTLTWSPPFSLNLTGVHPNIVYCVEVVNITCGAEDLVVGDCNVTEPRYMDNRLQQGHVYRIAITPRSNGQNAQNGTSNTNEEIFTFLSDPRTSVMLASGSEMATAAIQLKNDGTVVGGIEPASYSLILSSVDGIEGPPSNTSLATSFTLGPNTVTLNVSGLLPRRRLWNYRILALGCLEHPISDLQELSTHDFQNISVSSSQSGEITVSGDFISGSSSVGILAIVYSNDSTIHYQFLPRSEAPMAIASGLPNGQYEVSVFVIEESGLPFNRSAATPKNVSLPEGVGQQTFFGYEVSSTSAGTVCINCTFQDVSATGCVAVVHERISQLNSSGLMNIESSHRFNRSGDIAHGCIQGVNVTDYQIGVFSLMDVMTTTPTGERRRLKPVTIGLIVLGVVVLVILVALLISFVIAIVCCKKIRLRLLRLIQAIRECCQRNTQKESGGSDTLQRLTTDSSTPQTNDEVAYDVLRRDPIKPLPAAAKEGAVEHAAIYSILDQHPPQSDQGQLKPVAAEKGTVYSSVNLGTPSGVMGHDDLHKTTMQYSTLQHQPQQESSFNEGAAAGNADNRSCENDDTAQCDQTFGFRDECTLVPFHSIQGPTMVTELTTLVADQNCVVNEGARISATQCTDPSTFSVVTTRSSGTYEEWQHKNHAHVH